MTEVMIVGEAWGRDEEIEGKPFVGASGRLLNSLLHQVGISRRECYLTNVFNLRPESNDVKKLCGPKAGGISGWPALTSGKYVRQEFQPELDRLFAEVKREDPNLIIALGGSAAWALLQSSGIRAIRGAPATTSERVSEIVGRNVKVLPTYHPAAVLRDFRLRPIVFADLTKAKREASFPEVRRPQREVWIEPELEDLWLFKKQYLDHANFIGTDIETKGDQITCIGFAPSIDRALVVPFFDAAKPNKNYWPDLHSEIQAWDFVRAVCSMPVRHVFQNGLYDMHFLWRSYGITVPHAAEDTMLLHHALQPEMQKSLGFLATIYTDEASWKFMRKSSGTVKREDN